MEEPKATISVRVIALKEYTNIMEMENYNNFSSLLIKISLISGRAVRNLQSMPLLGIQSHLPSVSHAFHSSPFQNMEVLLVKTNGSLIVRKVPKM